MLGVGIARLVAQRATGIVILVLVAHQAVDATGLTDAARDRIAAGIAVEVRCHRRAPKKGTPTNSAKMPQTAMMVYGVTIGIS